MSTPRISEHEWDEPSHYLPSQLRYDCCGAWWEDGCQCEAAGPERTRRRCSRCRYPLYICDCHYDYLSDPPEYTNGDRQDDVDNGHPMGDGGATYLDD